MQNPCEHTPHPDTTYQLVAACPFPANKKYQKNIKIYFSTKFS